MKLRAPAEQLPGAIGSHATRMERPDSGLPIEPTTPPTTVLYNSSPSQITHQPEDTLVVIHTPAGIITYPTMRDAARELLGINLDQERPKPFTLEDERQLADSPADKPQ